MKQACYPAFCFALLIACFASLCECPAPKFRQAFAYTPNHLNCIIIRCKTFKYVCFAGGNDEIVHHSGTARTARPGTGRRILQQRGTKPGSNSTSRDSKIAYGTVASYTQFPSIAPILFYYEDVGWAQGCGGSLIAKNLILTAAHCLFENDGSKTLVENIAVPIGGTTIGTGTFPEGFDVLNYTISDAYDHTVWDQGGIPDGDIAILKLSGNSRYPIVKLATSLSSIKTGTKITAAGWGTTQSGQLSNDLLYTTLTLSTADKCQQSSLPDGCYCASK